ncbi:MAG: nitroreductase family protein [Candidatus Aminicenantales bacterium]|jgi:nitroreductase
MTPKKSTALDVIHSRKSVREFTGEAVARKDLDTILRAAMAAPSAVNCQPWAFVVVTEHAMLNTLADGLPYAQMLRRAGAGIVVCAVVEKAFNKMAEFAIIDSALAAQNILLAAEALGLGAVWTAAYPDPGKAAFVRETLRIPKDVIPLAVIPVGYPAGAEGQVQGRKYPLGTLELSRAITESRRGAIQEAPGAGI